MAKPCGCGGGGLTVRCRNGIKCSGLGSTTEPLVIEWEIPLGTTACNAVMDCVGSHLGPAFIFDGTSKRIELRLDPDPNNLAKVGPSGLLVAGTVTPGSGAASVAKLLTLPVPVIGGTYGAGMSVWPEGTTYAYEQAAQLLTEALSIVHVPVRRSAELLPVTLHNPSMNFYNSGLNEAVADLTMMQARQADILPSGPNEQAEHGYFGFGAPRQKGVPMLSEIFNILGNKVVLYLEAKDADNPIVILDRIKQMVPAWDASKSVIVAAEPIPAPGEYPTILHAAVASMAGTGIPVAAHLTSPQQVQQYNGATLAGMGVQWVAIQYGIIDDEGPSHVPGAVQDYKNAGLEVLVHSVHRQWQYDKAEVNAVRGVLCYDPIYATGKRSNYRYRRNQDVYTWNTAPYGLHSSYSAMGIEFQRDYYRGSIVPGQPDHLLYRAALQNPGVDGGEDPSGYWPLHGRMAPFRNGDRYAMQCWIYWETLIEDRSRWIGLWFDRPTDRSLSDWTRASRHTIGYSLTLDQNSNFVCAQYDGTPAGGQIPPPGRTEMFVGPSGYGQIQPRIPYGIRIEVEPNQIRGYRIGTVPANPPPTKIEVFRFDTSHPKWARFINGENKGYPFFGRHFFQDDPGFATDVRIIKPSVQYDF